MAAKAQETTKITMAGKEFDFESLTLDEIEEIEEKCGGSMGSLDWGRAKVVKQIAFVFLRRDNPNMKISEIGAMTFTSLMTAPSTNGASADK